MRTARLVGLSQDGQSLVVATDDGEEYALPVDERLRAVLRGDRPRLGQLEIEMESVLSPRDIQARIRSGATLEEVARVSGMPADRVERFAGPVLLEREHMAGQAMASSVRRRGETSGHRNLRLAVTERLADRGIDPDTVDWDARRLDDGRWAVTAEYKSGESARTAEFHFDPRGRYSLAGNDEARWVLGEATPAKTPQPARRRPQRPEQHLRPVRNEPVREERFEDYDEAAEPTLDLNDELALVRAVQVDEPRTEADREPDDDEPGIPDDHRPAAYEEADYESSAADGGMTTLYGMLGGDGYAEDSVAVYPGLRDQPSEPVGWEPEIVVNHPPEPEHRPEPEPELEPELELEPDPEPDALIPAPEPEPEPAKPKRTKKKRASIPSWDEIMFGGPPRKD
ncbi:septation protein SepH [Microlunatus sp. GCM10028923]|uniref:septation protein SepH n=1 Tax=Microlunatus sp. GCM10028923 TaxID=3273400 RepID=UPI00361A8FA2